MYFIWKYNILFVRTIVILFLLFSSNESLANIKRNKYISIGTGGVSGVYYPIGSAVCRLLNKSEDNNYSCSVEATSGSLYNVNTLRAEELDFAVVQSDLNYSAYKGENIFANKPFVTLRSLFSIYIEPMQILVRKDSGIKYVKDIVGKRVNIGSAGSGVRILANYMLKEMGIDKNDFKLVSELKSSEQAQALCDNKVDVLIWSAGVPNGSTVEATSSCEVKIVPFKESTLNEILESNPAYSKAVIKGGTFHGNNNDINSYGPRSTFVTYKNISEDKVYFLVKSIFDNFSAFKKLHPALKNLKPKEMITKNLTAPLHRGAVKYYKERGWM